MKKILTLTLAIIMALSLVACGDNATDPSNIEPSSDDSVADYGNATVPDEGNNTGGWEGFIGSRTAFSSLTEVKDNFAVTQDGAVSCSFDGTSFTGDMSTAVQNSDQAWVITLQYDGVSYYGEITLAKAGAYNRFDLDIKNEDGSYYVSSNGNKAVLAFND